ncbi:MAG: MFS transporter [Caulobacterales bacterium]|uniref:MFS transporter n=1 Tax=Sphingomonas sp. 66-10 TaxID=1895848 RepID=UPI000925E6B1|nr:MFS transporter [Sphingomonas sp. 66-10]MBN9318672.1 MFS transporter [Caulobacterales bacterium]OJU14988.1 MAG: hypothetical protein BGN95_09620 [Sphingomonas sp. 66-10]
MANTVQLAEVIDNRKLTPFQMGLFALCALVLFFDGFDVQAIGFVAPAIIKDWSLPPGELGPVFSAGLFGLMLGALLIAPLADKVGRKPIILVSAALFGVFTLATAWADSVASLLALRFLTGLGLGGCMPNAIALTSEYAPARQRAFLITMMFNGFSLGSLVGGVLAGQFIPTYGWRAVFIVGGALPLLALPLFLFALPESARFLALAGKAPDKVAKILRKLDPRLPADVALAPEAVSGGRMSVAELFRHGQAPRTLLLWLVFFCSLLVIYMMVNWLPTLMTSVGASIRQAVTLGIWMQVGGIVGSLVLGWIIDRKGPSTALIPAYLGAAACVAGVAYLAGGGLGVLALVVFGVGFGVIGGQTGANAVAATVYPTHVRSTGVGWALGIGRIGSIVGPAVGGVLISLQAPVKSILLLTSIPAMIAALAVIALGLLPKKA